jgi:multidrug efflux system outer membrane protein
MKRFLAAALLPLIAAGCAVGPNYQRPPVTAPNETRGQIGPAEAASLADSAWWDVINDDTLKDLIDEALRNGYDVRIAAARVEEARANAGIARSEFWPQIQYQGQWSRTRNSDFVTLVPNSAPYNLHDVNLGLSWEIDLWGRIRRLSEAALAQYYATEDARRGVLLSLVSEVATQYFTLRELDVELDIAKRTEVAFQETYDLFSRRLEGGAASALETSSAEASLAIVAARIPRLESQIVAQENLICLLIGRNPGPIARGKSLTEQLILPEVPPGLPSDLLQRRPDLRESEQNLVAANAAVGVAMANFFPTISLTGTYGGISPDLSNLFTAGKSWQIAAGLIGPLFQGGRIKNQYDAQVARWEEAKAQYERAVTSAFSEVSSALVAHEKLVSVEKELARAVTSLQQAVQISNDRYLGGLSGYLDVLTVEQQLFPAENALAQVRLERLANFVSLYKALGGGWNLQDPNWLHASGDSTPQEKSSR